MPWENYAWSDEFVDGDPAATTRLDAGRYDVWTSDPPGCVKPCRSVTIRDSEGTVLFKAGPENATEEHSLDGRAIRRLGSFKAGAWGNYQIKVEGSTRVYIKEPSDGGTEVPLCLTGIVIGAVFGAVLHYGFAKPAFERRRKKAFEDFMAIFRR